MEPNSLDLAVGVKTYKNPILTKSNFILLTKKEKFETFLKTQLINSV